MFAMRACNDATVFSDYFTKRNKVFFQRMDTYGGITMSAARGAVMLNSGSIIPSVIIKVAE